MNLISNFLLLFFIFLSCAEKHSHNTFNFHPDRLGLICNDEEEGIPYENILEKIEESLLQGEYPNLSLRITNRNLLKKFINFAKTEFGVNDKITRLSAAQTYIITSNSEPQDFTQYSNRTNSFGRIIINLPTDHEHHGGNLHFSNGNEMDLNDDEIGVLAVYHDENVTITPMEGGFSFRILLVYKKVNKLLRNAWKTHVLT